MADEATTETATTDAAATETAKPEPQGTDGTGPVASDDLDAWKAASRKHEDAAKKAREEAKANAAAAKELADLKAAQMSDQEKAEAAAKATTERAEVAERKSAILQAVIDHGLTKDDIEFLEDVPADKIADRAKKLAARNKAAANTAGTSGAEVGGGKPSTTEMDPAKIAANAANRKPQVRIF